ncbi:unnamed protein product [Owenia fusiformis]|uniref:Galactosylgalactosylxylosylprotein 3-beta-glucuronosyltransferase n=1 Tax=Owenia fusiformis TaxID=6347 RepID=A0A8S4Q050_OWEFU|nr:unnamed protein product [Owenia fusiformis]
MSCEVHHQVARLLDSERRNQLHMDGTKDIGYTMGMYCRKGMRFYKAPNVLLFIVITVMFVIFKISREKYTIEMRQRQHGTREPIENMAEILDSVSSSIGTSIPDDRTQHFDVHDKKSNILQFGPRVTDNVNLPWIYMITPTYDRPQRMADITRLAQTLSLVPNLHWIIIEDSDKPTTLLPATVRRLGIRLTYLAQKSIRIRASRGMSQRNVCLKWLQENHNGSGVIYFGDDDNTYDIRIFEEMRYTNKISMWPVGIVANMMFEGPVVKNGKVIKFVSGWSAGRKYAIDMSGFSFSVSYWKSQAYPVFPIKMVKAGHYEDEFLKLLNFKMAEIEPKASNGTQILVWHTQTVKPNVKKITITNDLKGTNIEKLQT